MNALPIFRRVRLQNFFPWHAFLRGRSADLNDPSLGRACTPHLRSEAHYPPAALPHPRLSHVRLTGDDPGLGYGLRESNGRAYCDCNRSTRSQLAPQHEGVCVPLQEFTQHCWVRARRSAPFSPDSFGAHAHQGQAKNAPCASKQQRPARWRCAPRVVRRFLCTIDPVATTP